MHRHYIIILIGVAITVLVAGIVIIEKLKGGPVYFINKVKSGLFTSDSLKRGNLTTDQLLGRSNTPLNNFWTFYGSAIDRKAAIDISENTRTGLTIGIRAANKGEWAGYFAMSRDEYASLFHSILTTRHQLLKDWFSVGLYIQTSVLYGKINYVACIASTTPRGVMWTVESGTGNATQVTERHELWRNWSNNQPLTRDCTIITNGDNYLKVYLDNNLVFLGNNLELHMPRPFNSYLEVQSTNSEGYLYGTFKDYYSTSGENVTIINAPVNGSAKIIETKSKKVLVDGVTGTDGIASMNIGQYHFPLHAQIQVYNSKNNLVASTPSTVELFGGDVYSLTT